MKKQSWLDKQVKKVPFEHWFQDSYLYDRDNLAYKLWEWVFHKQLMINSLIRLLAREQNEHAHFENRYHRLLQQRSLECEGTELDWSPIKAKCGILTLGTSNAPRNINR